MRRIGAIGALMLAGCSLGFVAGPPPQHAQLAAVACTDNLLAPILDSVFGGLAGLTFLTAATSTDEKWAMDNPRLGSRTDVAVLYGSLAALAGASALYGYYTVHSCRAARRETSDRVQDSLQHLPPTWPPPGKPPAAPPPGSQPPAAPGPSSAPGVPPSLSGSAPSRSDGSGQAMPHAGQAAER